MNTGETMTQSLRDALERLEQLREPETEWLAKSLSGSISNLGYPVGCGIAPDPDALSRAANVLFDRFVQVHTALISAAPQQGECSECDGKGFIEINGFLDVCQACDGPATPPTSATVEAAIHYPGCWDTVAYPTIESALSELLAWFQCSQCASQPAQPVVLGVDLAAPDGDKTVYWPTTPHGEAQAGETPMRFSYVYREGGGVDITDDPRGPYMLYADHHRLMQAANERERIGAEQVRYYNDALAKADRTIAALRAQLAAQQWQSVETAPSDMPVLLGWWEEWPQRKWRAEVRPFHNSRAGTWHGQATHWMPLPAAPAAALQAGSEG